MSEPVIHLKPGKDRPVLAGHPWIFSGAIAGLENRLEPGSIVAIEDAAGKLIGRGYVNPRCAITVRVLTRNDEPVDAALVARRIEAALTLRHAILPADTNAFRLLNGEGDFLPGVVADVYGSTVVLQCLTAGAERLKSLVVDALVRELRPACIYERSVGNVRREEGLAQVTGALYGDPPTTPVDIRECGLQFQVDVQSGQKTGFFLDQRDNRRLARELPGRSVAAALCRDTPHCAPLRPA